MPAHIDIFDRPEPLGKSLVGSILFHGLLVATMTGYAVIRHSGPTLGDQSPTGGSVAITPVSTIPLPSSTGPANPVANDTRSQVPTPKEAPKPVVHPKPAVKPPEEKAIPLKSQRVDSYTKPQYAQPDKYRAQQKDVPNQLYSRAGQQMSSPMFAIQGSGQIGTGENAPFGNQFGAYAQMLRTLVANKWRTQDIDPQIRNAPQVIITFTLHRDGSIGRVRISQSSGLSALDRSAQRAILDASPFPQMPPQFPKDQTDIDFVFELKR